MLLKTVVVTEFMTNCFILGDEQTKKAFVVDPGGEAEKILHQIESLGLEIVAIVNTHAHVDHIEQWQHGGQTVPENARLTHRHCNVARRRSP